MEKATKKVKVVSLGDLKDKHLGKAGTPTRDLYEFELKMELVGAMIKELRQERGFTQEALGEILGVKKAQISKLENGTSNVTIGTLEKVFTALNAKVNFEVELLNKNPDLS